MLCSSLGYKLHLYGLSPPAIQSYIEFTQFFKTGDFKKHAYGCIQMLH